MARTQENEPHKQADSRESGLQWVGRILITTAISLLIWWKCRINPFPPILDNLSWVISLTMKLCLRTVTCLQWRLMKWRYVLLPSKLISQMVSVIQTQTTVFTSATSSGILFITESNVHSWAHCRGLAHCGLVIHSKGLVWQSRSQWLLQRNRSMYSHMWNYWRSDFAEISQFSQVLWSTICLQAMRFNIHVHSRLLRSNMCQMLFYVMCYVMLCYMSNGPNVFTCPLGSSQAFDRVVHGKSFQFWLQSDLPGVVVRCSFGWYRRQQVYMDWNNTLSAPILMKNDVKQGGMLSLVMSCVYFDELIYRLRNPGMGCYIVISVRV